MLNKALKLLVFGLVICPLTIVWAAEPEFHYEANLTEVSGEYRRVELPWFVLANLLQANQADLQVVNADNQVVPSHVQAIGDIELRPEERSLNFFRGDDPTQLGVLLQLEPNSTKPKLEQLALADRHYLIIQNAQTNANNQLFDLKKLNLLWRSDSLSQWLPKTLTVEMSDDLYTWQPVATKTLPYILKEKDLVVENHTIEFTQVVKARFLRLSGQADFAPVLAALQSVSGIAPEEMMQRITWQAVPLLSTNNPQQFHYVMPPSVPVKHWRMQLTQTGELYTGELESRYPDERYGAERAYGSAMSFLDYRLSSDLGELRAPNQSLPNIYGWYGNHSMDWRWNFTQPKPIDPSKAVVEFAWQPLELRFLAQGKGPFRLVYASYDPVKAVDLPFIGDDTTASGLVLKTVEISTKRELKPLEVHTSYRQWLLYILWGVLIAAVLLLLWMARYLWKDLNKSTPQE